MWAAPLSGMCEPHRWRLTWTTPARTATRARRRARPWPRASVHSRSRRIHDWHGVICSTSSSTLPDLTASTPTTGVSTVSVDASHMPLGKWFPPLFFYLCQYHHLSVCLAIHSAFIHFIHLPFNPPLKLLSIFNPPIYRLNQIAPEIWILHTEGQVIAMLESCCTNYR